MSLSDTGGWHLFSHGPYHPALILVTVISRSNPPRGTGVVMTKHDSTHPKQVKESDKIDNTFSYLHMTRRTLGPTGPAEHWGPQGGHERARRTLEPTGPAEHWSPQGGHERAHRAGPVGGPLGPAIGRRLYATLAYAWCRCIGSRYILYRVALGGAISTNLNIMVDMAHRVVTMLACPSGPSS